jgi:hypothetical protein
MGREIVLFQPKPVQAAQFIAPSQAATQSPLPPASPQKLVESHTCH